MDVAPGTVVVWSDLTCPWATLAVHRLHGARARLGSAERVRLDHRAFPLELFNEQPTPRRVLAAEVPVVGARAPELGWQVWRAPESEWPVTVLLAMEGVQAAKEQGLEASEQLDYALRQAFFAESRCISMRHVVLDVAARCPAVDVEMLRKALDDGRARRTVIEQREQAEREGVKGSPHVFLHDGGDVHNPGVRMHWEGDHGRGFPVIDDDDPSVYDDLVRRAAG
ncbi:MAG TPA: DsbA family protein [Acidimicrobiales bacterium]|nr:DsbA family protein [Acidimicrobiales bacterium]